MSPREKREMPADFEKTYRGGMVRLRELREKYRAGNATIERWIDTVKYNLEKKKGSN